MSKIEQLNTALAGLAGNAPNTVVGRLLTPEEVSAVAGATDGGSYTQSGAGNYTQSTCGTHAQAGGDYTQSCQR